VNLAGVRILFELEERLGTRILERLYSERRMDDDETETTADPEPKAPERAAG
jgi:hypothetical protein